MSALRTARMEADCGIRSSWYILHTSPYYGNWKEDVFLRHSCMRHIYRQIEDMGHEIGLHTDGLHVYQGWGADGAAAVREEIEWLREAGLKIEGTTAHNSVGAYGACNYAIFKGRQKALWDKPGECPDSMTFQGKTALLQQLDEKELGLRYECNELFWQDHSSVGYGCIMASDNWHWEEEKANARILVQMREGTHRESESLTAEKLLQTLADVPKGTFLNLVVHPVYYGWRHVANSEPARS
ncbi:MAG: hypothetical protein WD342_00765 [Verrucomicrobiales bacterium]